MDIKLKPDTAQPKPKPVPATLERQKLDRGSQFAQVLNKVTKPAAADIKQQPAALAPLAKTRSPLELTSLRKVEELYTPQSAALEKVGKTRAFIQAKPANQG